MNRPDRLRRREFSLSLDRSLATAHGAITDRTGFIVAADVGGRTAEEAATGIGEATPLPGWTESMATCRDALDAVADGGLPEFDTPAARHAVTLANRDAFARRRDESVAATLTADPAESVPVNATVGDGSVEETVTAARDAMTAGFRTLKVKVGARPLDGDLERVRAVADTAGEVGIDVALRADANGGWDRETAARAVRELDGLVAYVEQPLPADDIAGHVALRGEGAAVALDESLTVLDPFEALTAEAADVLVLKPMVLGGVERSLAVARAGAHRGVESVVTTTIDAAVARTAAVHLAAALPGPDDHAHGLATASMLTADVVADPEPVKNGRSRVPEGPGLAGDAFDGLV